MRWETKRVSYDLQAGVIVRQPTINVKCLESGKYRNFSRSVSLSTNQSYLKWSLPSVNLTIFPGNENAARTRVQGGFALHYIPAEGSGKVTLRVEHN